MRIESLGNGLKLAAGSAVLLFIAMFFPWFGASVEGFGGVGLSASATAWQAFELIDIILLVIVVAVILLAAAVASEREAALPVETGTIITVLGAIALLLIFYRFLDTPFDLDRRYGLFLGILAAAGIIAGGRMEMVESGTTFADARSDVGGRVDEIRAQTADAIGGDAARYEDMTRDELYELAQKQDVEGRSEMSKDELIAALRR